MNIKKYQLYRESSTCLSSRNRGETENAGKFERRGDSEPMKHAFTTHKNGSQKEVELTSNDPDNGHRFCYRRRGRQGCVPLEQSTWSQPPLHNHSKQDVTYFKTYRSFLIFPIYPRNRPHDDGKCRYQRSLNLCSGDMYEPTLHLPAAQKCGITCSGLLRT